MRVEIERKGDVLIFRPLDKRLDALVASEFKDKVIQSLDEAGTKQAIIDMREVSFVDSSGLGALVSVLKHVARGGRLVLCSLQKAVDDLMELTRLHRIFDIAEDVEGALEVIGK